MNAKLKPKLKQMTVTSRNPIVLNHALNHTSNSSNNTNKCSPYSSSQAYSLGNDRNNLFGLLASQQNTKTIPTVVDNQLVVQSGGQKNQQSSAILRQKLLHRHRNNSPGVPSNSTKTHRKGYNRSQNNGFKFHNFVVNEDKRACLEEQHGTKKITVSHWKRPVATDVTADAVDETLNVDEKCEPKCNSTQQQSILEALLAPNSIKIDQIDNNLCSPRVNKRKPLHVRRVLRHEQQTAAEDMDQDQPLDLSCKKSFNCNVEKTSNSYYYENYDMDSDETHNNYVDSQYSMSDTPNESVQHLIKSVNQSAAEANAIIASIKCSNSSANNVLTNDQLSSPSDVQQPQPSSSSSIAQPQQQFKVNSSYGQSKQQKYRQTQRSLIKKQLEETFKQNGFLVKTKQVSDANNSAMFCKFRQLRKYTRYYLKSWHHHLPDEVNKLWKGFLPPKTEKPSSSHT